jgi:hypothetical protein
VTTNRRRTTLLLATVTPLASIFGSGFLIIVPILTRAVGPYAVFGMAAVCLLAWWVGNAIRRNVQVVEAGADAGTLNVGDRRLERASDLTIVVAYTISVALYLRILAQFVVGYLAPGSGSGTQQVVALAVLVAITLVGVFRGLDGLDLLERIALASVLVLVAAVVVAFAIGDLGRLRGDGLVLPPSPGTSLGSKLLVLGGLVITVQGFETVRYLRHIDAETRVAASRLAQRLSTGVYLLIVALATPLMASAVAAGRGGTLLELVQLVTPVLALPLVLCATLSQFSAAIADTEAGYGNVAALRDGVLSGRVTYVLLGLVAGALIVTTSTLLIVVVASRAFAGYYALQCLVAARNSPGATRGGYIVLAVSMAAIAALAQPAG